MLRTLFFSTLIAATLSMAAQTQRVSPELLWQLGRVSLDDVSPDGATALYGVTYYDLAANKSARDLYTVPVKGGAPRKITAFEGSEVNGRYRPDGKKIGFLYKGKLWEMDPDGSNQRQLSDYEMQGFEWAPDGTSVRLFNEVKYEKNLAKELYPDLPLANARIMDALMYRHWNEWEDGLFNNLFIAKLQDGKLATPQNILNEAYDAPIKPFGGLEQCAWSPDGKYIAYACKKKKGTDAAVSTDTDIYLYEIATGNTRNLTEGMDGYDLEPVFSPDGRSLLWVSMERPAFEADRSRLFVYNMATGAKSELTAGMDRDMEHPQWSADGKFIYARTAEKGTSQLAQLEVATRKLRLLTNGQFDYNAFKLAGSAIVAERVSMSDPAELFRVEIQTGAATALTEVTKGLWSSVAKAEVKPRTIRTTDNKDMLAWVIYPPDFDPNKKYPTLLYCQGGPQSQVSQFFSYRWNFQQMAANGYIVVAPNRRGLPGFGQAWNDQISGDWGGQAMQDLLSAIDDVAKEPYVDKDRLGAVGASFGGYSVYWLAGNHNKRFKTFISHCGLFNLESWYGTTEEMFFANFDLKGPYWDPALREAYERFSPHKFVQNWDTPILVIHGEKDFRVPVGEGMQAFQAAQLQGINSRFLYFPEEGHWVNSPQNSVLWMRVFNSWLDQHLQPDISPKR